MRTWPRFGMLLLLGGGALPVWAMDLPTAMQTALDSSPAIHAARAALTEAEEGIQQAFAGVLPTVTGTGSWDVQRTDSSTSAAETTHPRSYALTIAQPIYEGGGLQAARRGAENLRAAAQSDLQAQIQTTLLATVEGYLDILVAQEVLRQQQNLVTVFAQQKSATVVRFEAGDVTRTDVKQAESRLAQAQATLVQARGALVGERQQFAELTGQIPVTELQWPVQQPAHVPIDVILDVRPNVRPDDSAPVTPHRAGAVSLTGGVFQSGVYSDAAAHALAQEDLIAQHPELMARLQRVSAANYTIALEQSDRLPSIAAGASVSRNEGGSTETSIAKIGLNITVPFYQGGRINSEIRAAMAARAGLLQDYEVHKRLRHTVYVTAVQDYQAARSSVQALQAALAAAQLAAQGINQEALLGDRTVLDVLDSEQAVIDAEVQLARARADVIRNQYRLLAAVGRLQNVPTLEAIPDSLADAVPIP